ncbi:MAG: hypothetical protein VX777_05885 [Chlamydiota bacterium]|nr:hypothetical protein [Chlamydiota bacterium]
MHIFQKLALSFVVLFLVAVKGQVYGYDYSPSCLKRIETSFFEQRYVEQALNLHKVGQSSWGLIISDLKQKSLQVPGMMMAKARTMKPNPLDSPFDPKQAEKILHPLLFTIFRETLISYNFTNESGIRDMFEYIYSFQEDRIKRCLYGSSRL